MSNASWPIVGHDAAIARLQAMIAADRYPATILITGAPQAGRRSIALQFAAGALCPNSLDQCACQDCGICRSILRGSHPDVTQFSVERQEAEGRGNRTASLSIETARAIGAGVALLPRDGARRFVLVDDAETLPEVAQQALLKTLEDVPSYLTFILIATVPSALLDTVRSRCTEIPLQLVPTAKIEASLSGPNAAEIARLAAGRPGLAIAAANDADVLDLERNRYSVVEGWIATDLRSRLIEAYKRGDRFGKDRPTILAELNTAHIIWRDVLFAAVGATDLQIDPDRTRRLLSSTQPSPQSALTAITATERCSRDLISNVRPRLALEYMVTQWPTL